MAVDSVLIVAVPSVNRSVRLARRIFDPTAREGMPAHVTVLYPFLDPAEVDAPKLEALAGAIASVPSFAYRLARIGWFDRRVVYLAPEPAEGFKQLTSAVMQRFPGCLPYNGAFDSVVPHATLGMRGPALALEGVGRLVAPQLPISAVASEVLLMSCEAGRRPWRVDHAFPLG